MAGEQTKAFIDSQRKAGKSDLDIFSAMMDSPKFSAGIQKGNQLGHSNRDIARGLGLNIPERNQPVDLDKIQHEAMLAEAKKDGPTSAWESGLLGFSNLGAGLTQGFDYIADGVKSGINKIAGTNLDTKSYERFTKARQAQEEWHALRREAHNQGFDWARLGGEVASTAPMAVAGRTYQGVNVLSKAGMGVAAHNAALGAALGGASFAGDSNQRAKNMAFGAAGGAVGGAVGEKLGQGVGRAIQAGRNTAAKFSNTQTSQILSSIDQKLDDALRQSGISFSALSEQVKNGLREDAMKALQSGKVLNPEAVASKTAITKVGMTGTRGQITRNPKHWNTEAELAKIQGPGDSLREKFISDNKQLNDLLEQEITKTGGKSVDQYNVMQNALNSIDGQLSQNKDFVSSAYDFAQNAVGNDIKLGGAEFVRDANKSLNDNYASMSLPPSVRSILKSIERNPDDFTLGKSEEIIKKLNDAHQHSLKTNGTASSDTYAIGLVREALNNRQNEAMQSLISTGNDAAQAYQFARSAHKFNVQQIEAMPLLQDALKGMEPDKLFNKHILGGNVAELNKTMDLLNNVNPQVVNDIKQQTLEFISAKAVNANGQFSPAGMKRALDTVGNRQLDIIFGPEQANQIKDIGMAGHYLVSEPNHAYVNHSNTSAGLMNRFAKIAQILGKAGHRLPWVADVAVAPVEKAVRYNQAATAMNGGSLAMPRGNISTELNLDNAPLIERLTRAGIIGGSNLPNH